MSAEISANSSTGKESGEGLPAEKVIAPSAGIVLKSSLMAEGLRFLHLFENYLTILKERYPERKLIIVDSLCSSGGYGMLVDYCLDMRDNGCKMEEILEKIKEITVQRIYFHIIILSYIIRKIF